MFDLETNGLLHDATRIHCIALHWCEEGFTESFNDEPYGDGTYDIKEEAPMAGNYSITTALSWLETADVLIGHNIIGFDIPIIKRLYPYFNPSGIILDTLILSRLYYPNLRDIDQPKDRWGKRVTRFEHMPTQLIGRHSLEAWGCRLGEYKGNFAKTTDWSEWSQEMEDYCKQDVAVTTKLCNRFLRKFLTGSY